MEWVKKNVTLVLGIGMPAVMIALFALAAWVPQFLIDPPKYDVLYLSRYNDYDPSGLRFTVHDKHVSFEVIHANFNYNNEPKLYRYSPSAGTVKEIPLHLSDLHCLSRTFPQPQGACATPLSVPEAEALTLDTSDISPDGYEFHFGYERGPGLAGELLFSPGYRGNTATLTKNGRVFRIPANDSIYNYYNIKFIGWVVS